MIRFLLSRVADRSRREVASVEGRRARRLAPRIEGLEDRELLSSLWVSVGGHSGPGGIFGGHSGPGGNSYSPKSPPPHYL